jgi:hypothetical protein
MNHSAIQRECDNESNNPHHFRFWIFDFRLSDKESSNRMQDRSIMLFSLNRNPELLDDFIRPLEHAVRNCQTNLFCRFKVYDEFKLRCLLHRQISRFGTFQNLVHVKQPRADKGQSTLSRRT